MHLLISAPTEGCVYPHRHAQTHTTVHTRHAQRTHARLNSKVQVWAELMTARAAHALLPTRKSTEHRKTAEKEKKNPTRSARATLTGAWLKTTGHI